MHPLRGDSISAFERHESRVGQGLDEEGIVFERPCEGSRSSREVALAFPHYAQEIPRASVIPASRSSVFPAILDTRSPSPPE